MSALARCLVALFFGLLLPLGAASVADQVNRIVELYESKNEQLFDTVRPTIERYISRHRSAQLHRLRTRYKQASGDDQLFLAYHLLRHAPREASARNAFEAARLPVPFDEQGVRNPEVTVPVPADRTLIELVSGIGYPPLDDARQWLAQNMRTWANKDRDLRTAALTALLKMDQDGHGELVRPVMAIYFPFAPAVRKIHPPAAKVERAWLGPVDRYLLANGLAGVDVATYKPAQGPQPTKGDQGLRIDAAARWNFPIPVRNVQIEIGGLQGGTGTLSVGNRQGQGVDLVIGSDAIVVKAGGSDLERRPLPADFAARGLGLELLIQGRQARLEIDGVPGAVLDLPMQYALARCSVEGRSLRCATCIFRYVGDRDLGSSPATPAPPQPPAPPAWLAQRHQDLGKTLSFSFQESALSQVVATIAQLSGVAIALDASAQDLGDLPINLAGRDMALEEVFTWLKRTADLTAKPGEQGFVLSWGE